MQRPHGDWQGPIPCRPLCPPPSASICGTISTCHSAKKMISKHMGNMQLWSTRLSVVNQGAASEICQLSHPVLRQQDVVRLDVPGSANCKYNEVTRNVFCLQDGSYMTCIIQKESAAHIPVYDPLRVQVGQPFHHLPHHGQPHGWPQRPDSTEHFHQRPTYMEKPEFIHAAGSAGTGMQHMQTGVYSDPAPT